MPRARHLAWAISAGLHLSAAAALLHGLPQPAEEAMPVMLLEMPAPQAVAPEPPAEPVAEPPAATPTPPAPPEPETPPEPVAPDPPPLPVAEAKPPPEPMPEPIPDPPPPAEVAELPLPPPPPPKPVARPPVAPRPHPTPARAPAAAEPPPPAAPAAPAAAPARAAVAAAPSPNYAAALMRALQRHRHYPEAARWRRVEGVALLRFRMRRDGTVIGYRIERSAGDPALDQAVQEMIQSASPLPAPPDDLAGDPVELTVPVRFTLR